MTIKESIKNLDKSLRVIQCSTLRKRIKVLKLVKKGNLSYQSKIAQKVGLTEKTVRELLKKYDREGLSGITTINSGGNRKRVISETARKIISEKLHDPSTTITSYVELASILENDYGEIIKYKTLYAYAQRNFNSKLKVSRKSHHKKNKRI